MIDFLQSQSIKQRFDHSFMAIKHRQVQGIASIAITNRRIDVLLLQQEVHDWQMTV